LPELDKTAPLLYESTQHLLIRHFFESVDAQFFYLLYQLNRQQKIDTEIQSRWSRLTVFKFLLGSELVSPLVGIYLMLNIITLPEIIP
jgi:hypothetical protein